jgi:hypothetical protein
VSLALLVPRVIQAHRVLRVIRVSLALLVPRVILALKAHRVSKVSRVSKDLLAKMVTMR